MFVDLLEEHLGRAKTAGTQKYFCCPFCEDDKFKFYVNNTMTKQHGLWDCKKCGEVGNAPQFVMKYFEMTYHEAIDVLETYDWHPDTELMELKASSDKPLTDEELIELALLRGHKHAVEDDVQEKEPTPLPTGFNLLETNMANPRAFPFLHYLHSRGVSLEDIITHRMGYVEEGTFLNSVGEPKVIRNHVVFQTIDNYGKAIYWNTRAISSGDYLKTINASAQSENQYSRKDIVFNLNRAITTGRIIITEGVFDALTVGKSGVATLGKGVATTQVELIRDAIETYDLKLYIFLDKDAKQDAVNLAYLFTDLTDEIYMAILPDDRDANKLGYEKCQEILNSAPKLDEGGSILTLLS